MTFTCSRKGERPASVQESTCFPPPASLLVYHLTLRSDLKSAIIISTFEQGHKYVFIRKFTEALFVKKKKILTK